MSGAGKREDQKGLTTAVQPSCLQHGILVLSLCWRKAYCERILARVRNDQWSLVYENRVDTIEHPILHACLLSYGGTEPTW